MNSFDIIMGIDQTGAVKSNGQPKPLPVAVLTKSPTSKKWEVPENKTGKPLYLSNFFKSSITHLLKDVLKVALNEKRVFIAIDTVFGLPRGLFYKKLEPNFKKIIITLQANEKYGFCVARDFFESLKSKYKYEAVKYPKRKVEVELNANSLFQTQPFQKNIQTGSFRIWSELAKWESESYQLWPFDHANPQVENPVICEAYPSHAWKVLNNSNRSSRDFAVLKSKTLEFLKLPKDLGSYPPDHLDAFFIAALAAYLLQKDMFRNLPAEIEGDILGSNIKV